MKSLISLIRKIVQQDQIMTITSGVVTEVNGDSCTVEREGMADLFEVRLNAVRRSIKNSMTITPKVGSDVQCAVIENQPQECFIVSYSEIEKVVVPFGDNLFEISEQGMTCNQGQSVFKVNSEGITIERNGKNLLDELSKYIDEVSKIVVVNGVTPNVPALALIKTNMQSILK